MQTEVSGVVRQSDLECATTGKPATAFRRVAAKFVNWIIKCVEWERPRGISAKSRRIRLAVACVGILLVAFGVRILRWQDIQKDFLQEENFQTTLIGHYEREARQMVEQGYVIIPRQHPEPDDARMLMHPPGYSILLVALYGENLPGLPYSRLRLAQILCDCVAAVLVVLLAAELLRFGIAFTAGLLVALSPHLAYYSLWLSPDSLAVSPILLAMYLFVKAIKRPHLLPIIATGFLIGVSCWLRTNTLALTPLLALASFLLFGRGYRLKYAIALVAATAVTLSPITIRNWVVYQRFIPVSLNSGLNLIQGIAEYDQSGRFGLPASDVEALEKDVEWHGRPDYGVNLYAPDGIDRDQTRLARGVEVIRSQPLWFAVMMLKRMAFMVRYNDFDRQVLAWNTSIAPAVSQNANYGHDTIPSDEVVPLWTRSASEWVAEGRVLSEGAEASVIGDGQAARFSRDGSKQAEDFVSAPFALRRNTDYLLKVPFEAESGSVRIQVKGMDPRITLAFASLQGLKKKRRKQASDQSDIDSAGEQSGRFLHLPFASGSETEARIVLSKDPLKPGPAAVRLGEVKLFEMGPTPYAWTRYPRALIRGIQKNIYNTGPTRWLIFTGIFFLAVARRKVALAALLLVPAYYLCSHAAFSTEHRYILAMHYFLFIPAAVTVYSTGAAVKQAVMGLLRLTPLLRGSSLEAEPS